MVFDGKQKRAFQTVFSGLKFAFYGSRIIRFLTLTTSLLCRESVGYENGSLNKDFQILKKRVCRYSPYRLYREGYISKKKMISVYGRSELLKNFNFEYFKVETNEGNGVLHILYRGSWLPYSFLVDNWQDIHLSFDVNIKKVDLSDCKSASCYVVSQYVSRQENSYVRSSQSWKWVFRGFKSLWYSMRQGYPGECFELWDNILKEHSSEYFYPQTSINDFG
jgi:hypothetical protein